MLVCVAQASLEVGQGFVSKQAFRNILYLPISVHTTVFFTENTFLEEMVILFIE